MRRELVGLENALRRTPAHPYGFRQHPAGPVGCFSRRWPERQVDHSLHGAGRQRWFAGIARRVSPSMRFHHEPRLPSPRSRRCCGAAAFGGAKKPAGEFRDLSWSRPIGASAPLAAPIDYVPRSSGCCMKSSPGSKLGVWKGILLTVQSGSRSVRAGAQTVGGVPCAMNSLLTVSSL